MGHGPAAAAPAQAATAASAPGAPAATLSTDSLDKPAAASVEEAERAGGMAHHMSHGNYRHVDADKVPDAKASGHGTPASAPAEPQQDPHAGHEMPREERR